MIKPRKKLYLTRDLLIELFLVGIDSNAFNCIDSEVEFIANFEHLAKSAATEFTEHFEFDIETRLNRIVGELSQVNVIYNIP